VSSGAACTCLTSWPAGPRPVTPSHVWTELRRTGTPFSSALRAVRPAVLPLLRPVRSPLGPVPSHGRAEPEAVAVLEMPLGGGPGDSASRFSRVAAMTAALLAGRAERACRLGVTVDLRRQEALGRWSGIGNASAVGYVNIRAGRDDAPGVDAQIRRLLGSRFWRQQAALDAWLQVAPASATGFVAGTLVRRVTSVAPVTVTELWRQDRPRCRQCGLRAPEVPDGVDTLVFPPALPPGGLTVGMTRSLDRIWIVLRRTAARMESAVTWLGDLLHDRSERLEAAGVTLVNVQSLARGFPVLP
jgi:hypothetical protein